MRQDLAELIQEDERAYFTALEIRSVTMSRSHLRLVVVMADAFANPPPAFLTLTVLCVNAVDYSIRPNNPATLLGGPPVRIHDQHPLLDHPHLQLIPGQDDGEVYNPPRKFRLLIFDQSHVIAEKFEIEEPKPAKDSSPAKTAP